MTKALCNIKTWIGVVVIAVAFSVVGTQAFAAQPLVDVNWVKANAGKPGVVIIDARGKTAYLRGHIPGALNTNYGKDGWRVKKDGVPGMFPANPAKLIKLIGNLGVDDATHVVLVAPGNNASDMGIATRMYWTFKVLGHDNLSILNGGMKAYLAAVDKKGKPTNPLQKGVVKVSPKVFKASLRKDMLINATDVKAAMNKGEPLVDNRTSDQYLGVNRHPKAKAYGTIPGAINLPENWVTKNNGGVFRGKKSLEKLYAIAKVPTSGAQINFCNTGHWASIGWFASSEILGNKNAQMYDGSMLDWTYKGLKTQIKINANS